MIVLPGKQMNRKKRVRPGYCENDNRGVFLLLQRKMHFKEKMY